VAGLSWAALTGPLAVALAAALQRVADVSIGAGADSPLLASASISAWVALGSHSAWVVGT